MPRSAGRRRSRNRNDIDYYGRDNRAYRNDSYCDDDYHDYHNDHHNDYHYSARSEPRADPRVILTSRARKGDTQCDRYDSDERKIVSNTLLDANGHLVLDCIVFKD